MPTYVNVKRQPGDYRIGKVLLGDIYNVHWDNTSGGVHAKSSDVLYGYIYCDKLVSGEVAHSCEHGDRPHYIKVFIPMKDNDKGVINQLKAMADSNGKRRIYKKSINFSDAVREIVAKNPGITPKEIYPLIPNSNLNDQKSIDAAIHYLKKHSFKDKAGLIGEKYQTTQKLYIKKPSSENTNSD